MSRSVPLVPDLGETLPDWSPPAPPEGAPMTGRYASLEALDARKHAAALHKVYVGNDQVWDYLPYGPFETFESYFAWTTSVAGSPDPLFYAIRNHITGDWEGVASYLRVTPQHGTIEVGHINFSPALQGTVAATEAMFLMMRWAFDAGYRRYEWKCNALNLPSRRAAQRLGFSFEGVFRQAMIIKGRNRDTAWFAVTDREWPALRSAYTGWLDPANFVDGHQRSALSELTEGARVSSDPVL